MARDRKLINVGLNDQPAAQVRRLAIVNLAGFLAAISSAMYAINFLVFDATTLWPAVLGNIGCVIIYSSTPLWHRYGINAAPVVFVATAYTSLFYFTYLMSSESGIQLNYLAAGALAFVLFGAENIRLISLLLLIGLSLHVTTVIVFDQPALALEDHPVFLQSLYVFSAGSIIVIVASIVWCALRLLQEAEAQSDRLLRNILPETIAARLKSDPTRLIADRYDSASVLFADIVGFTPKCSSMPAEEMLDLLNCVFCQFDDLAMKHGAEKIKTIGDAYMAAVGVPIPQPDHALAAVKLALEMLETCRSIAEFKNTALNLRIGIATGSITAGVIGHAKFAFDVWSPTVNLAARLESSASIGGIHICSDTKQAISENCDVVSCGIKSLKGIGAVMTWQVVGLKYGKA